jgi:hypothetical protein
MKKDPFPSTPDASAYEHEPIPGLPDSRTVLVHHREQRAGRITLLIPAGICGFGLFLCLLSLVAGWDYRRVERPLTDAERQVHLAVGEQPPATYAVRQKVFGKRGMLMAGLGSVTMLGAGALLLARRRNKRRHERELPALVRWLHDAPGDITEAWIERQIVAEVRSEFAVSFRVPVLVAKTIRGERSELELPRSRVDEVARAVGQRAPQLRLELGEPEGPRMVA